MNASDNLSSWRWGQEQFIDEGFLSESSLRLPLSAALFAVGLALGLLGSWVRGYDGRAYGLVLGVFWMNRELMGIGRGNFVDDGLRALTS